MPDEKIVIIGAGVTGLTAAEKLSRVFGERVIVLEKEPVIGGLAATLVQNDMHFDLGSHRLHIESSPAVIRYIEEMLGDALLRRQRRGRLYFQGRFLMYPPNIFNLLKAYSTSDIFKSVLRYTMNLLFPSRLHEKNFETGMIRAVGWDIYHKLYRGYAKKLWGIEPRRISIDGMHKRKTVIDLKSIRNAFRKRHYYLYPKYGIGDIADTLKARIMRSGARIIAGVQVNKISVQRNGFRLSFVSPSGSTEDLAVARIVSTIPIDDLYSLVCGPTEKVLPLRWRGIRLVYIHFDRDLEDKAETYYFPSEDILLGRVSEIKKYSPYLNRHFKGTLVGIEIPASKGDYIWGMEEQELVNRCLMDLKRTHIIDDGYEVLGHFSRYIDKVYPVYEIGWRGAFFALYDRLARIHNLFTIGRGGLFLHCNIDHCMAQGLELAGYILKRKSANNHIWHARAMRFLNCSARD